MPTKFFWERWHRAVQMDMANKLAGKHTHYWIEADEWVEAFKKTLSNSQLDKFNKEWNKLEELSKKFVDNLQNKKQKFEPTCF